MEDAFRGVSIAGPCCTSQYGHARKFSWGWKRFQRGRINSEQTAHAFDAGARQPTYFLRAQQRLHSFHTSFKPRRHQHSPVLAIKGFGHFMIGGLTYWRMSFGSWGSGLLCIANGILNIDLLHIMFVTLAARDLVLTTYDTWLLAI